MRPKQKIIRNKIANTRLTEQELSIVKLKAEKAGLNLGEYLRDCALDKEIKERPIKEGAEILKLIQNMASNLNQISKKIHLNVWNNYDEIVHSKRLVETLKELKEKLR